MGCCVAPAAGQEFEGERRGESGEVQPCKRDKKIRAVQHEMPGKIAKIISGSLVNYYWSTTVLVVSKEKGTHQKATRT